MKIHTVLLSILVFMIGLNVGFFSKERLPDHDKMLINESEIQEVPVAPTYALDQTDTTESSLRLFSRLNELENRLDSEIAHREVLETQIASLELQLELLEGAPLDSDEAIPENQSAAPANPATFRQAGIQSEPLIKAGVDPTTVDELVAYWNNFQLEQLELRDTAAREGWLGSEEYQEKARTLREGQKSLREEIGEDKYDLYLYESGQNNRVAVHSVIAGSVAESIGLRSGDIISSYADNRTFTSRELQNATRDGSRGETVNLDIIRNGESFQFSIPRGPLGIMLDAERIQPEQ